MNRGKYKVGTGEAKWDFDGKTILTVLGLNAVPTEGLAPRVVYGIVIYADPLKGPKPLIGKRHTHRMKAICPDCKKHMSLGRLHQHVCGNAPTPQRDVADDQPLKQLGDDE